jgi:hypothetical protein
MNVQASMASVFDEISKRVELFFRNDNSRSKWRFYLGISIVAGIVAVFLHTLEYSQTREFSAGFLLAGASLFLGVLVGFIFGIPKTSKSSADSTNPLEANSAVAYSLNTNLEEISDWLTKMLVGVGLVQLTAIPGYIRRIAIYWESSIGKSFPAAYVAALIIFFLSTGFLMGYLWTRLALIGDFIEQDPRRLINSLIDDIAQTAKRDPNITSRTVGQQVVSVQELRTAEAIAKISSTSSISLEDLRGQIDILAAKYESIRATMPSGDTRTREMEIVASQIRGYALAAFQLLPEYTSSDSSGKRLVAIAFLETKPDPRYFKWLADRFSNEVPFLQYHAAIALRNAAKQVSSKEHKDSLRVSCNNAIQLALQSAESNKGNLESDRILVLRDALRVLGD